jgi:hypothetical protein
MHPVEKLDEGSGDGDISRVGALKDNHPAGAVDAPGREIHCFREIAVGVMQDVAKRPDGILRPVRCADEGAAFRLVEKEALSLFVE